MTVTIIPINQRAKNRVLEHGNIMELVKEDYFNGVEAILAGCIGSIDHNKCAWCGWLDITECDWKKNET